jgi:glutathione S-transferase
VELSPFALKLAAMLSWAGVSHRWLPREGGRLENLVAAFTVERAKRTGRVVRHGGCSELDEFPQVPFLIGPDRLVYYDSSALADWIDATHPGDAGRLVPEDPVLGFIARLIDEAFDEFGLYMVHHNRWVLSAGDNDAGARLGTEFARFLPPGGRTLLARSFPKRQVRRLPYLFSVAPGDYAIDLPADLTPPARSGFPATHALLDRAWQLHLAAMEKRLEQRPYLLGQRFCLADASVYGQLSMNLTDRVAAEELAKRAPRTHRWLCEIREGAHLEARGALEPGEALRPLLDVISQTFIPLMRQNDRAYRDASSRGETLFNEAAFDRDRALYDGELLGTRFRSVVKTFQVRTWRDLRTRWQGLAARDRATLDRWLPDLEAAFSPMT